MKTLREKTERVLAVAYFGLHNVPGKIVDHGHRIEVCVPAQLATYDFDNLTRLVITAHDECVRLQVTAGPPRRLKLMFHDRKDRTGAMHERHPTLESAMESIRGADQYGRPPQPEQSA